MNEKTGPYRGLKVMEARAKIAEDMTRKNLLAPEKTEREYKHNVATCYKCGSILEPLILKNQWFVRMTEKPKSGAVSLRDLAVQTVKSGKIKFVPARFEKIFFHWMKNLRDWNISRQIPWGIKIPEKGNEDVFDTWFSSAQWPFATLKTGKPSDFKEFYPTDVMETGHDILFFWVARMIMLGIYTTGKIPFKTVYLHGLVRDKDRQKMSKSKGNAVDPLGVAEIYGADALRMALIMGNAPGNDPVISEEKIRGFRNFATKIWNVARFILMNYDERLEKINPKFSVEDKKNLAEFKKIKNKITKEIETFKFHEAASTIYHYFWHVFADKIIESSKPRLRSENTAEQTAALKLNLTILENCLKLLHPFMPFVTEEIYSQLPVK
ncbi:MAG: class I tRNA ligase family protein, partial [Patescibacteria group bacterium]